ncbi:MAG: ApaLI family restriction endonuclease [Candidatus Ancillula sp.]|jgi:type II restriction enzyme|nr:ApaLI family restriction endonuclease [Candidatus Ancillula sp.]
MSDIYEKINELANKYASNLKTAIDNRSEEMKSDDNSHYLIYQVLGISDNEGRLIDEYQNKGRFLYKYAGSFLEEAAILCFEDKYSNAKRKIRIPNTQGVRPKTFEIDCLVGKNAYEIKWRDATTDGDHITKEHTRLRQVKHSGYTPIRIMFYYPNRSQAIKIQQTLETIYAGVGGQYHYGDNAWKYIKDSTGIDLPHLLEQIAANNIKR